jgi:hypothetical protein
MEATKEQIIDYLDNHIIKSLKNDVESAIYTYTNHFLETGEGIGNFAIPRLIFPEIDNMGCLLSGTTTNTSADAIIFMKKYFSLVSEDYNDKSAFLYIMYRHGLIHQHFPKFFSVDGNNFGWSVGLSTAKTSNSHLKLIDGTLHIDGRQFYEDFIGAIHLYMKDIELGSNELIDNFNRAFIEMSSPLDKQISLKRYKYLTESDLAFLNE